MCEITNVCNLIVKENSDEIIHSISLKEEKSNDIIFRFNDGEEAIFTNDKVGVKNLQEFLDLMNKTHILQKQLDIATKFISFVSKQDKHDCVRTIRGANKYEATFLLIKSMAFDILKQIEELNK